MLFFYAVFSSKTAQSNVLNIYRLRGICLFSPCQWPLLLDFFLSKYFRPLVALNLLLQPVLAFKTDKMLGGRGTSWRWPGLKQQWQRFWFKNQSPSPLQSCEQLSHLQPLRMVLNMTLFTLPEHIISRSLSPLMKPGVLTGQACVPVTSNHKSKRKPLFLSRESSK